MKEKDDIDEETNPLKNEKINDLLEPLVNEEKPKIFSKRKLYESVNVNAFSKKFKNDSDKNQLRFDSIELKEERMKKIRNELKYDKDDTEEISNYSNIHPVETLKFQNFIFIIFISIFSSFQFGIYIYIYNTYLNSNNSITNNVFIGNKFYILFLILSWKFQIYFVFYLIYAFFVFFKQRIPYNKNNSDEDSAPLMKANSATLFDINPTYNFRKFKYKYLQKFGSNYSSYFSIFYYTSNIFNYENKNFFEIFLNLDDILKGISGLIFSFSIFMGSYFFYFGIIYFIQSITAMIPYYIQLNISAKNNINKSNKKEKYKFDKFIFPLLASIGFYFLQKSIPNYTYNFFIILILIIGILTQIYNQKKFVQKSHDESPFHILFKTYFIFFLISNILVLIWELIFNKLNILNLFFWLTDLKLFLTCIIGFGIFGAILYNMSLTFIRIALSNNVIVKLIKYFNLVIIDLIGIFIFRLYDIGNKADYFVGLTLCGISLFLLDFSDIL